MRDARNCLDSRPAREINARVISTQPPSNADTDESCNAETVAGRLEGVRNWLRGLFQSEEVDRDPRLKIICGCLLLYCHMTFYFWWQSPEALSTLGNETFNYAPAGLIQNFRWLAFMDYFQTRTYLYVQGMLALLGLFSLFYLRSSLLALCLLAWLAVNKVFFYLCDFRLFANYHHFHLLYTLVFLISSDKLRFFRCALGLSYIMSALVKLSPSWLFGEYFNSLPDKLPLLPKVNWLVTAACVGVIVLEFIGPLCWLTSIRWLRRLSFGAFVLFHIYSGVIVGFWYTTLMLPLVVAAFLGFDEPLLKGCRIRGRNIVTVGVFGVALMGGVYHFFIPGDARLTSEGRYFGLFMFDATRSVRFEADIQKGNKYWTVQVYRRWQMDDDSGENASAIHCDFYQDGRLANSFAVRQPIRDGDEIIFNPAMFASARMRIYGDPYLYYYYARELVRRYQPDRVAIRLDQRLDGHKETVRLIDIPDFGQLNPAYNPFSRNEWIQLPGDESPPAYRWP